MASSQPVAAGGQIPAGAHTPAGMHPVAVSSDAVGASAGVALVPSPRKAGEEESEPTYGPLVARLPVELDVAVPVREFRVRHLLALEPGTVIESRWNHGSDLPLAARDVTLAWTEFEVIETRLGVRVTRLA
ncbi:MAG: FliM/FliN family flagellar motor switch protein [Terracidiphilus sp.]|jgi:flagellar motor switch/type III secretory pathway protein FliN